MDNAGARHRHGSTTTAASAEDACLLPNSSRQSQCHSVSSVLRTHWLSVLIGCVLMTAGMAVQFWNEGRAVRLTAALNEAASTVVTLRSSHLSAANVSPSPLTTPTPLASPAPAKLDSALSLVHLSDTVRVPAPLHEPPYHVSIAAVKLKRRVQMFQWVEQHSASFHESVQTDEKTGSGGTYHYYKAWRDKVIDSSAFNVPLGHENPSVMSVESRVQLAPSVLIGSLTVGRQLRRLFDSFTVFTSDRRPNVAADEVINVGADDPTTSLAAQPIKLHGTLYYHCRNIEAPRIGDVRVQFSYAGRSGDVYSVLAGVDSSGQLQPFITAAGGQQLLLLLPGRHSAASMLAQYGGRATLFTWSLRAAGWLLVFAACLALTQCGLHERLYAGWRAVNMPAPDHFYDGDDTWLCVFVSASLSLASVASSWLVYRPLTSLAALLLAAAALHWRLRWPPSPDRAQEQTEREQQWRRQYTVTRPRSLRSGAARRLR